MHTMPKQWEIVSGICFKMGGHIIEAMLKKTRPCVLFNQCWQWQCATIRDYWWQGGQYISWSIPVEGATKWPTWNPLGQLSLMGNVTTLHAPHAAQCLISGQSNENNLWIKKINKNVLLFNFPSYNNDKAIVKNWTVFMGGRPKCSSGTKKNKNKTFSHFFDILPKSLNWSSRAIKHEWQWFKRAIQFSVSHSSD